MSTVRIRSIARYVSVSLISFAVLMTRDVIGSDSRYVDNAPILLVASLCVVAAVLVWQHPHTDQPISVDGKWRVIVKVLMLCLLCIATIAAQELAFDGIEKMRGLLSANLTRVSLAVICSAICVRFAGDRSVKPLNALMGIFGLPGVILVIFDGHRSGADSDGAKARRQSG